MRFSLSVRAGGVKTACEFVVSIRGKVFLA